VRGLEPNFDHIRVHAKRPRSLHPYVGLLRHPSNRQPQAIDTDGLNAAPFHVIHGDQDADGAERHNPRRLNKP